MYGLACFVPPDLLHEIARTARTAALRRSALDSLAIDAAIRTQRAENAARTLTVPMSASAGSGVPQRFIHDQRNGADMTPGPVVRAEGQPPVDDPAVNQAYDNFGDTYKFYWEVLNRDSLDDQGMPIHGMVHFDTDYNNAFWDGEGHMWFGDGDGKVFGSFTEPVDVLGHEFTHAVTQFSAALTYQDQSGALNESVSDCFGTCLKQRLLGQTADQADWLVGEGIFLSGINARALRDMAHPGTAYDDPTLGQDPQVGDMADYVDTTDDNGGVHTNSGIPNRAFYLAATAIGGDTWEGAGQIWYAALTGGQVVADTDFAGFAAATVAAAGDHADAVRTAWETVGVEVGASSGSAGGTPGGGAGAGLVRVRRTGGIAGRTVEAELDLASADDRASAAQDLVDRIDLTEPADTSTFPDAFSYTFEIGDRSVTVPQHQLSADQRALADLLLG